MERHIRNLNDYKGDELVKLSPTEFTELSVYNGEHSRGLLHNTTFQNYMIELQNRFDKYGADISKIGKLPIYQYNEIE